MYYKALLRIYTQSIRRIGIIRLARRAKVRKHRLSLRQPARERISTASHSRTITAPLQSLRCSTRHDAIVFSRSVSVRVAAEFLDSYVDEECQDLGGLPETRRIGCVDWHGKIDIVCTGEGRVVEEAEGDVDDWRESGEG